MKIFKKIVSIFLRISISIILLVFLFHQVDNKSLLELIKGVDKRLLFLGFLVFFTNYILCFIRWQMLLNSSGIRLPRKRVIISYCGGIFFSLFLPSTIGGDMVRSLDLAAHTKRPREVVATVFLDRLSGYVGLVMLTLLALILGWRLLEDRAVLFSVAIITGILIFTLLVLFNEFLYSKINSILSSLSAGKLSSSIRNLHREIYLFKTRKKVILNNLAVSVLIQAISPVAFYFIARSLGIKLNFIYFLIFIPIIGAITLLPISIGGLGLRDTAMIFFFAKAHLSKDLAFAMSLLSFSFILIYGVLGGLIYVLTVRHRRLQYAKSPAV